MILNDALATANAAPLFAIPNLAHTQVLPRRMIFMTSENPRNFIPRHLNLSHLKDLADVCCTMCLKFNF